MEKQEAQVKCRKNERGAALVTVLMISFLLFVAAAALLLEASMNTANVSDATAEEQAYYAAESGIQSVVNVLRGNVVPNPLIDPSKLATDPANKINYFKASRLCTSNICVCPDTSCDFGTENRLSRWMSYDTPAGSPDRVSLGSPTSGFSYKVKVENPDNPGNNVIISYNTAGNIGKMGSTWTNADRSVSVTYLPKLETELDVSTGSADNKNGDYGLFGSFVIAGNGVISSRVRFAINVNITKPTVTTKVIRGYIEPGTVTSTSVGNVKIFYDSQIYIVIGSTITLSEPNGAGSGQLIEEMPPAAGTGEGGTYRTGYQVSPVVGETKITGSITAPEPTRLLIRSTGFGPRGAQKQLEAVIQKNYFNGLSAPSPLTLIGPSSTTSPTTSFVFNPGTSSGTKYNGKDVYLKAFLPPIGVTNEANLTVVNNQTYRTGSQPFNGTIFGTSSNVVDELPFWLQSPANLDITLKELKDVAKASGRYFPLGSTLPANGDYGNPLNATGITYVEGNLEFSQSGGGILVVTGGLTFKGGFNFNGLIIVTGANGIGRTGGGSGSLQGNLIVAPYNSAGVSCIANDTTCFLAPRYDISGGGGSEIVYNSNNVANGLGALSNFVKGVAEK